MNNRYRITSNRESGDGRFDIQLLPLNKKLPGILMELKAGKDCTEKQLKDLAHTALTQIQEKQYHVDMTAQGIVRILAYGIAFSGKQVQIVAEDKNYMSGN